MQIYQFKNNIKNQQIWPRNFVAISLSSAIEIAKDWSKMMNDANDNEPHLLFTFDIKNVKVMENKRDIQKEGYIEW